MLFPARALHDFGVQAHFSSKKHKGKLPEQLKYCAQIIKELHAKKHQVGNSISVYDNNSNSST